MKKLILIAGILIFAVNLYAQTDDGEETTTVVTKKTKAKKAKATNEVAAKQSKATEKKEAAKPVEVPAAPAVDNNLASDNESWYTLWGIGLSKGNYNGDLGNAFSDDANASGSKRTVGVNLDLLGFYWPLANYKTMLGVIINTEVDSISDVGGTSATDTFTSSLLAFSIHHFFGTNIGDGWFLRGDIGFTRATIEVDNYLGQNFSKDSDEQLGIMLGGGYSWPISRGTRMLLGLYIRPLPKFKINGYTLGGTVTNLTAGFLF